MGGGEDIIIIDDLAHDLTVDLPIRSQATAVLQLRTPSRRGLNAGIDNIAGRLPTIKLDGDNEGSSAVINLDRTSGKSRPIIILEDKPGLSEVIDLDSVSESSCSPNIEHDDDITSSPSIIDLDDVVSFSPIIDLDDDITASCSIVHLRNVGVSAVHIASKQKIVRRTSELAIRNPPVHEQYMLAHTTIGGHMPSRVARGTCVELKDGAFLLVQEIFKDNISKVLLRGHNLQRCNTMNGLLPPKINELCWFVEVDEDDVRPWAVQSQSTHCSDDVVKIRNICMSSAPYPEESFRCQVVKPRSTKDALENAVLVVRWRRTTTFRSATQRQQNRDKEHSLQHLTDHDIKQLNRYHQVDNDERKRFRWRGQTTLGGQHCQSAPIRSSTIVLDDEDDQKASSRSGSSAGVKHCSGEHRYTFGDAFCGMGGASRGAQMAGLKVIWGFDKWQAACSNWSVNFPEATIYCKDAKSINEWGYVLDRVDVLHMSFPCQFFSPAHTVVGVNDEDNYNIIFSCGAILNRVRPRMGSIEETFGLDHPTFRQTLNSLIGEFTCRGYSVRWSIPALQDWGLPQRRKRLIILFAGPGETLARLPTTTHGPPDGADVTAGLLKPYATIEQTISPLERIAHDYHTMEGVIPRAYMPYNGNEVCPRTITCHGGRNYHPSGGRDFTRAEFLLLQGFPSEHRLGKQHQKKLIGNAFPPTMARLCFLQIVKALRKSDGYDTKAVESAIVTVPVLLEDRARKRKRAFSESAGMDNKAARDFMDLSDG